MSVVSFSVSFVLINLCSYIVMSEVVLRSLTYMLGILRQIAERDIIAHFWSSFEIKSGKHKHSNLCRNRATIKGTV